VGDGDAHTAPVSCTLARVEAGRRTPLQPLSACYVFECPSLPHHNAWPFWPDTHAMRSVHSASKSCAPTPSGSTLSSKFTTAPRVPLTDTSAVRRICTPSTSSSRKRAAAAVVQRQRPRSAVARRVASIPANRPSIPVLAVSTRQITAIGYCWWTCRGSE